MHHNFVSKLDVSCSLTAFFRNICSMPDKMEVQMKKLYVYQYLLFAAIQN